MLEEKEEPCQLLIRAFVAFIVVALAISKSTALEEREKWEGLLAFPVSLNNNLRM